MGHKAIVNMTVSLSSCNAQYQELYTGTSRLQQAADGDMRSLPISLQTKLALYHHPLHFSIATGANSLRRNFYLVHECHQQVICKWCKTYCCFYWYFVSYLAVQIFVIVYVLLGPRHFATASFSILPCKFSSPCISIINMFMKATAHSIFIFGLFPVVALKGMIQPHQKKGTIF